MHIQRATQGHAFEHIHLATAPKLRRSKQYPSQSGILKAKKTTWCDYTPQNHDARGIPTHGQESDNLGLKVQP
jgi:hypothetical protein